MPSPLLATQKETGTPEGVGTSGVPAPDITSQVVEGQGVEEAVAKVIPYTGCNSVLRYALLEGDQCLPLGDHLLPAMVLKKW